MASAGPRFPKGPPPAAPARDPRAFLAALVDSSVGAKVLVALTGLGLVGFLIAHLIGNLKIFSGPDSINAYAAFLKHDLGALLWLFRGGLLAIFVIHLALAIRLKQRSLAARPVAYFYGGSVQSTLAGRTMIWTGVVVGLFTLFHLAHYTFGWVKGVEIAPGQVVNYLDLKDAKGRHDVYSMMVAGFSSPVLATLYIIAQLALYLHLLHGIQSSFQTLGLKNRRFAEPIRWLGFATATAILAGNLAIVIGVWAGLAPPIR